MARSLEEIDAEIAKVKAEMALRDRYTQGFNQPQTKVGWGSYIINNDRGLLDAYQNRENEWKNMLKQQEFQAAEAALNRKNAEALAKEQRRENSILQMDENMKSRANAASKQQYAQYDLNQAIKSGVKDDIERAKMNLALANNELEYWNKRVGFTAPLTQETPAQPEVPESRDESKSVPVKLTDSKAKKRFKSRDERANHVKTLEDMDPQGQSKEIQAEINRIKGLDTDEDKAERKKAWDAGKKLKGFEYRKWKESQEGKKLIAEFGE